MKKRKVFCAVLILALIVFAVIFVWNRKSLITSDPLDSIIDEDKYPYNGYYNGNSTIIGETKLTDYFNQNENISKHLKDVTIKIFKDGTITLDGTLQNITKLFSKTEQLKSYLLWAEKFENQSISAKFTIEATNENNAKLVIKNIQIGEITVDPALVSPIINTSTLQKEIQKIPFSAVTFENGAVALSAETPEFFHQFQ